MLHDDIEVICGSVRKYWYPSVQFKLDHIQYLVALCLLRYMHAENICCLLRQRRMSATYSPELGPYALEDLDKGFHISYRSVHDNAFCKRLRPVALHLMQVFIGSNHYPLDG